ncbi:MAG: hypothetical protein U9N07_09960 [Euryarchaeota archaeon]|nr:hypothetical protein [Euryarchaeota archaeon]
MKGITKPKGFGMAAILAMALLAMGGFGYTTDDAEPLVPQRVNITTKNVTLYRAVDPLDNTGEIYVRYSTDVAEDVDVKTGTQPTVVYTSQTDKWYATPCTWTNQPYAANALRIRIYDKDLLFDDLLYDQYHSIFPGTNTEIAVNNIVKVEAEVIMYNP